MSEIIIKANPKGSGRKKGFKFPHTPTDPEAIKLHMTAILKKTYDKRGRFINSIKMRLKKYPNKLRAEDHKAMTDTELHDYFIRVKSEYDRLVLNDHLRESINE
jgi:hypothetical protein